TGTFTFNNHYATTLFDSGDDYSFVSTTFIPLLGIEASNLGFSYEIEIASGQLVEIDKVVKIPLSDGKVLRVIRETPKEKMRHLRSAKTKEQKQEEIMMVRDYSEFLGHVINGDGIHVDPSKIKLFIENISKIAKLLPILTQKSKTFDWGEEQENAFQTLNGKLCDVPVLALLDGSKDLWYFIMRPG
nr:hypothetical protein [Tanacetum cinerariifolium]